MRLIKHCIIIIFLSGQLNAETVFKATYKLKWGVVNIGNVVRTLTQNQGVYSFVSDTKPVGLAALLTDGIYEKSVFKVFSGKLIPISYEAKESNKNIKHQYTDNVLKVSGDKNIVLNNIPDNAADYLNAVYMIMQGLKTAQTAFEFTIYENPSKPEVLKFIKKHTQQIKVPAGQFETFLVEKVKTDALEFKMWMAKKHGFIPVKIHTINLQGLSFSMELTSFEQ